MARINNIALIILLISIVIAISGCGGSETTSSSDTSATQIQVDETSSSPVSVVEPIYLNNCGGTANTEQTSVHSQTISISGAAEIGVTVQVVRASVGAQYVSTEGVSKSHTVIAPPGTNMEFQLLWTEQVNEGTASINGHAGQATYRVSIPISVEQISAENLGCPNNAPNSSISESTALTSPTHTPRPTLVPSPIPTISLDTPSGSVLGIGEYWRQNDISLILEDSVFDMDRSCVGFKFDLTNNSDRDLILTIVLSQFSVTDNTGNIWEPRALSHYVYCGDPGGWNNSEISTVVEPGESFWDAAYSAWLVSFDGPLADPRVTDIYVVVNGLSQFFDATWSVPIGR